MKFVFLHAPWKKTRALCELGKVSVSGNYPSLMRQWLEIPTLMQIRELPRLEADAAFAWGVGRALPHGHGSARGPGRRAPRDDALHAALRAACLLYNQQGNDCVAVDRAMTFSTLYYAQRASSVTNRVAIKLPHTVRGRAPRYITRYAPPL